MTQDDAFLYIADHKKKFHVFPPKEKIMEHFGVGKRETNSIVSQLVKLGYFEKGTIKWAKRKRTSRKKPQRSRGL